MQQPNGQQPNVQQRKQQATSAHQQQGHKENETQELENEEDTKSSIEERRSPGKEISMQHVSGGHIYRPSPEKEKEDEGGKEMFKLVNDAL